MSVTRTGPTRGGWNPPMPKSTTASNSNSGPVDPPPSTVPAGDAAPRAAPDIMADRARGPAEDDPHPMADLVVGWLVIVAGPGRGADFRLKPGMNSIGRGDGASIDLDYGDWGISPGAHCRVTYDPRSGQFFLSPGEGKYLTYLPGEPVPVLMPVMLRPMHEFEIGSTVLRLAPFCSPDFRWTD